MKSFLCVFGFHSWEYRSGILVCYRTCQRCWKVQRRLAIVGKWGNEDETMR